MDTGRHRSVILQFVMVLIVDDRSLAVPPAGESARHTDGRQAVLSVLIIAVANVLEARLVNNFRVENLRVTYLQGLLGVFDIVTRRRQRKLPNAAIGFCLPVKLVARRQRIVLAELVINSRAKIGPDTRIRDGLAQRYGIEVRVEDFCIHYRRIVEVAALQIEEKRRLLA